MSSLGKNPGATSCHTLLLDLDTESDGNSPQKHTQTLTQEEKNRNAILMSIADLGSARRSEITAVDKGHAQPVNMVKLLRGRDCEVPSSDAGKLAAVNKSQLAGWANFGNTAIARSAANEELDNIGNGQSHRQGMAERLLYTGVLNLEDSYDDRPRHKPILPPLSHPASKASGGAGSMGLGRLGSTHPSTKGYRPLDPAVVAGEKDSRYDRSGFQATAKFKSKFNKPNVRLDDSTVRVTCTSRRGRVFQKRPWPPKGLEHLIPARPLADPSSFMAAVTKALPALKASPCEPATVQPSSDLTPAAVQGPSVPSMTIQGVSLAVRPAKDECTITKVSRDELRAPNISPDGLTEGKPSPQILISPELESECTEKISTPVGLGIEGVETKAVSLVVTQAAKETQLDVGRIRNFLEKKDTEALVEYLELALGIKSVDPMQELVLPDLFKSKEPSFTAKADSKPSSSKTPSSQAPLSQASSSQAPSSQAPSSQAPSSQAPSSQAPSSQAPSSQAHSSTTESRSLTESIWAPAGSKARSTTTGRAPLKANPSKGNISEASFKLHTAMSLGADGMKMGQARRKSTIETESTTVFGDVTALCRLPGVEPAASIDLKDVKSVNVKAEAGKTGKTKIKRIAAGPGYEALVREMKQTKKEREAEKAKKETATKSSQPSPVTQALKFAKAVSKGLDFDGGGFSAVGRRGGDDSDGSDDWGL